MAKHAARLVARSQQDENLSGHKRGEESLARSRREEHLDGQKRCEISAKFRRPKTRLDVDDQTHQVHGEVVKTSTRSRRDNTAVFGAIAINYLKRFEMLSSRRLKNTFLKNSTR